jgi:formamidopyrimidine-DNA glycosylase
VRLSTEKLSSLLIDRQIKELKIYPRGRYDRHPLERLEEFQSIVAKETITVSKIENRGKFQYWTFSNGWLLLCTFGLTGQWLTFLDENPCLGISYVNANGNIDEVIFTDQRHFGTLKLTNNQKDLTDKLEELGWDPLQDPVENFDFMAKILGTTSAAYKTIAEDLMDQSIFAGVGNYIKAEALYRAKISPHRMARNITREEVDLLCEAIIDIGQESYEEQGATFQTYKTTDGEAGSYAQFFQVYGKKKDPLGHDVKVDTTKDKRKTYWVPEVQK